MKQNSCSIRINMAFLLLVFLQTFLNSTLNGRGHGRRCKFRDEDFFTSDERINPAALAALIARLRANFLNSRISQRTTTKFNSLPGDNFDTGFFAVKKFYRFISGDRNNDEQQK